MEHEIDNLTLDDTMPQQGAGNIKFPYLVFRIQKKYYAINCSLVSGIMPFPDNVVKTPCPSQYVKGIFESRGEFIPMVALRTLFNMTDIDTERLVFSEYIDMRIDDHLYWLEELRRCAQTGDEFTLSLDPCKCALGQWMDGYKAESNSVQSHLNKVVKPHAALHHSANELFEKLEGLDETERQETIETFFEHLQKDYVSNIVNILQEMKTLHNDSLKEMVVVLESTKRLLAIITDEIISVEDMDTEYSVEHMKQIEATQYISGVRRSNNLNTDVMVIDDQVLVDTILSVI